MDSERKLPGDVDHKKLEKIQEEVRVDYFTGNVLPLIRYTLHIGDTILAKKIQEKALQVVKDDELIEAIPRSK